MKGTHLSERFRKKSKKKKPQYDDELEELERENLLCGSKDNTQQNTLERLLYGDTQGRKTFSTFRKEGELTERPSFFISLHLLEVFFYNILYPSFWFLLRLLGYF